MKKEKDRTDVDALSNYQLAGWAALMDGVNLIAEVAEERGADFEKVKIDQIALYKYVDEKKDSILQEIERTGI